MLICLMAEAKEDLAELADALPLMDALANEDHEMNITEALPLHCGALFRRLVYHSYLAALRLGREWASLRRDGAAASSLNPVAFYPAHGASLPSLGRRPSFAGGLK